MNLYGAKENNRNKLFLEFEKREKKNPKSEGFYYYSTTLC